MLTNLFGTGPNVSGIFRILVLGVIFALSAVFTPAEPDQSACPADLNKKFEQQSSKTLPWNKDQLGHNWAARPKYFIVIGVTEIGGSDPPNKPQDFAMVDAENVASRLCDLGYGPVPGAPHNSILSGSNATRDNILAAIEKTAQIPSNRPLLILYYSGHGLSDASPQDLYLPLYDSKALTVTQSQSLKDLLTKLRNNYSGDLIMVLDACFSGTAAVAKLFDNVNEFSKTAILTSSSVEEFSYPITVETKRQSAFTHFFLRALQTGGDVNDGIVTLGDAHLAVTANLITQYKDPNIPPEQKLPGPMTPSITAVGVPRMVAYSRDNIVKANTTRRFYYSLEAQIVSTFQIDTLEAGNLPSKIVIFSRGKKIATYSVQVGPGNVRSLVPLEIASEGTNIDITDIKAVAVPPDAESPSPVRFNRQYDLALDDRADKRNKNYKVDRSVLDHEIVVHAAAAKPPA